MYDAMSSMLLRRVFAASTRNNKLHRMASYIAALDQGTTSTRCIIFSKDGQIVAQASEPVPKITPHFGFVECDAHVLINTSRLCLEGAMLDAADKAGISVADIKCVGVTNQRETTVAWDRITGKPLYNAISWQDTRTSHMLEQMAVGQSGGKNCLQALCGLPLSPYFSAGKMKWLLQNVKEVRTAADEGRLLMGTVDAWLIWNLTGGVSGGVAVTDVSNASRTMLMNLKTLQWDPALCTFFGVPVSALPQIRPSAEVYGNIAVGCLKGIPLSGCLGDQQAALVGQLCFEPGQAKSTYGTGCFVLMNTGESPMMSKCGLLTTVGYQLGKDAAPVYALEGSVAQAGDGVRWLKENIGMLDDVTQVGAIAASVDDTDGVVFVPALSGLLAPHWRPDVRGSIVGLSLKTKKAHVVRALLEAICHQNGEQLDAMQLDSGVALSVLRVDGGMSNSDVMMQLQADILGIDVVRPNMIETTAFGAAVAAGIATGLYKSVQDVRAVAGAKTRVFTASISAEVRSAKKAEWAKAIQRAISLSDA
eukprot:TRINITY_DN13367_c0_g1_i1.p1 TRINITY_DN13367_c0_g1~~TRINITY_DN13367_c0_g1_i1.p1  ORF type:complete len:534 (+),score=138.17 TRINITY_DN13367_c0_g1_i1:764-2365(+)